MGLRGLGPLGGCFNQLVAPQMSVELEFKVHQKECTRFTSDDGGVMTASTNSAPHSGYVFGMHLSRFWVVGSHPYTTPISCQPESHTRNPRLFPRSFPLPQVLSPPSPLLPPDGPGGGAPRAPRALRPRG